MCGIAGHSYPSDQIPSRDVVSRMTESITHRGPDAHGYFCSEGIALGHRRLSIIDLSDAATQPISSVDGRYTIIYNGEVYNYQEIRSELNLSHTQSQSDTDIILAAYEAWGPACLEKFNGMFGFAIWDKVDQSLFLARDRMGIKPLYYSQVREQLFFSSEIRSLLASGKVSRKLNHAVLGEYLSYYSVNAPNTLVKDVYMLPAGCYALFKQGQLEIRKYWDITKCGTQALETDAEEVRKNIKELLGQAVAKRKIADVPLGAFLSGGIDSSTIVALLAAHSEQPIHTFSIVFDDVKYDESYYSRLIAKKYNTQHHPLKLRPDDFLQDLPQALDAMDHPSGDGLNSYVVSRVTRKEGFTVALSGLGGDELFGGYPVFRRYQKLKGMPMYAVPQKIRSGIGAGIGTIYQTHKTARLQEILSISHPSFRKLYPIFRKIHDPREIASMLHSNTSLENVLHRIFSDEELDRIERLPLLSQVSVGEMMTYTQNVLLRDTDQMSMASALEVRVPFFDHELVEYVLSIPDAIKQPEYSKKLLVESMGDLLPKEIVFRPKMGFVFPWESWIKNNLRDFCEKHIQELAKKSIIQGSYLIEKWNRFLSGEKREHWMKVWMLVMLNEWLEKNEIDIS